MDPFSIVVMRKDDNNILSEEVASFECTENGIYIESVFSILENGEDMIYLKISTERDLLEWEFSAMFDYYDEDKIKALPFVKNVIEFHDHFNPVWEVIFAMPNNEDKLEEQIATILEIHNAELQEVYDEIMDKEDEYK